MDIRDQVELSIKFCSKIVNLDKGVADMLGAVRFLALRAPESMWMFTTNWPENFGGAFDGVDNVWVGVEVHDEDRARQLIPALLNADVPRRFVMMPRFVDLTYIKFETGDQLPIPMRVNDEPCSLDAIRGITTWPGCHYQSPTIVDKTKVIDGEVYSTRGETRKVDMVIVPFDIAATDELRLGRDGCKVLTMGGVW